MLLLYKYFKEYSSFQSGTKGYLLLDSTAKITKEDFLFGTGNYKNFIHKVNPHYVNIEKWIAKHKKSYKIVGAYNVDKLKNTQLTYFLSEKDIKSAIGDYAFSFFEDKSKIQEIMIYMTNSLLNNKEDFNTFDLFIRKKWNVYFDKNKNLKLI